MRKTTIFAATILLAGCAAAPKMANVIPRPDGVYSVTAGGATESKALQSALYSAEQTCKARSMHQIVTAQKTAYRGLLSEGVNATLNRAADIAGALAWIPTASSDEDYQITLEFTCAP